MSVEKDLVKYVFAWHCLSDACEKCQALNGREWHDQDIYQGTLWDIFYGDIWDLNVGISLAHPNCRCQLEVRVEIDVSKIEEFNTLEELLHQIF